MSQQQQQPQSTQQQPQALEWDSYFNMMENEMKEKEKEEQPKEKELETDSKEKMKQEDPIVLEENFKLGVVQNIQTSRLFGLYVWNQIMLNAGIIYFIVAVNFRNSLGIKAFKLYTVQFFIKERRRYIVIFCFYTA